MKKAPVNTSLALAITITLGSGRCLAADQDSASITLRVVNEAHVKTESLIRAEKEASAILGRAGIHLTLISCEAGQAVWGSQNSCQRERGAAEFWLYITDRKPPAISGDVLGFAVLDPSGDHSAGIYYSVAADVSSSSRADTYQILGAAIAHELGHLILGANEHSPEGVMSARFGPKQLDLISLGKLHFNTEQALRIQVEVKRLIKATRPPAEAVTKD